MKEVNSSEYWATIDPDGRAHIFALEPSQNGYGYWHACGRKMEVPCELMPRDLMYDNKMKVKVTIEKIEES